LIFSFLLSDKIIFEKARSFKIMTDTAAERLRATEKNELHRQHLYRVLDKSQLSTVRRKRGGKQASIFKPQTKQISATDDAAASSPNVQMGDNPCRLRGQKQSIDLCQCQSRRQTAQRLSLSLAASITLQNSVCEWLSVGMAMGQYKAAFI